MTVRELIAVLQQLNGDAQVWFGRDGSEGIAGHVDATNSRVDIGEDPLWRVGEPRLTIHGD